MYPVQPDHPYSVTAENEEGGEFWRLPLELKGAEVVLRTPDGKPFEVRHAYGKGQVIVFRVGGIAGVRHAVQSSGAAMDCGAWRRRTRVINRFR